MTHTTVDLEQVSYGSQEAVLHQINITSLDAAGQENYAPWTEVNIPNGSRLGVQSVGQDNETARYTWNTSGTHLNVQFFNSTSGALEDVPNNDSPGEVRLLVVGGGV